MGKNRGFRVLKWCIHRRTGRRATYQLLQAPTSPASPLSKMCSRWIHSLRRVARSLCSISRGNSGYGRAGPLEQLKSPVSVPKGHLAVYVGDHDDDTCRVLVPVVYFNHPLFGELLKEAEKVYGFYHSGGIQIPCPKSHLHNIQMKIAAAGTWRRLK